MERAEVDRQQNVGSGVAYDDVAARLGTLVCLRKARSVQGLIACTRCAFPREASAVPQYLGHLLLVTSSYLGDDFVLPTAVPFPDGVGDGLVCRRASHCRSRYVLQMHALCICTHWLLGSLVSVQFELDSNRQSDMRSLPVMPL